MRGLLVQDPVKQHILSNMGKNKNAGGFVYSTNANFDYSQYDSNNEDETLAPEEQNLRVWLERKGGNKITTVIKNFIGPESDILELGKSLKQKCATGGAVKDGNIIIQGDHRKKVLELLQKSGFKAKASGG